MPDGTGLTQPGAIRHNPAEVTTTPAAPSERAEKVGGQADELLIPPPPPGSRVHPPRRAPWPYQKPPVSLLRRLAEPRRRQP